MKKVRAVLLPFCLVLILSPVFARCVVLPRRTSSLPSPAPGSFCLLCLRPGSSTPSLLRSSSLSSHSPRARTSSGHAPSRPRASSLRPCLSAPPSTVRQRQCSTHLTCPAVCPSVLVTARKMTSQQRTRMRLRSGPTATLPASVAARLRLSATPRRPRCLRSPLLAP